MSPNPNGALWQSIEGLYDTFESYKLLSHIDGCDHCTSVADHAAIRAAPLRQLTAGQLSRYAFKAMTTWGSVGDFRHFLPRVFELLATGAFVESVDTETVLGKLAYGNWRTWPVAEQRSVEYFLLEFWRCVLNEYPSPLEADSLIWGIAQAIDDMSPYLAMWDVAHSRSSACHFAEFVAANSGLSRKQAKHCQLGNAWWADRPASAKQVSAWLLHADRLQELERAFYDFNTVEDADAAALLSDAFNDLGTLRLAATVTQG